MHGDIRNEASRECCLTLEVLKAHVKFSGVSSKDQQIRAILPLLVPTGI